MEHTCQSHNTNAQRPLRLCLFISHFWPNASGAENQAYQQGVEFARRGHTVDVLTRQINGYPREEKRDGLHIHRHLNPISMGPLFGTSFLLQSARSLLKSRKQFDLIHTHQGLWEASATGLIKSFLNCPSLVQPASGGWDGEMEVLNRTRGRTFLRKLIHRNDHFAAISQQIADELRQNGIADEAISLTNSGVDIDRFSPGESRVKNHLPTGKRVLFLGRLHPQKNLEMLLQAWKTIISSYSTDHSDITSSPQQKQPYLIIIGDGPLKGTLHKQCREMGIHDSVIFLGSAKNPEEYLRAADLFVLPSRAEGSPNALLEAMSTGLTCLVSDIGGNVDLIENGVRGFLLPTDQADLWAQMIRMLLDNPDRINQTGTAAREWIVQERSIPSVVDEYEKIYGRLIHSNCTSELRKSTRRL